MTKPWLEPEFPQQWGWPWASLGRPAVVGLGGRRPLKAATNPEFPRPGPALGGLPWMRHGGFARWTSWPLLFGGGNPHATEAYIDHIGKKSGNSFNQSTESYITKLAL